MGQTFEFAQSVALQYRDGVVGNRPQQRGLGPAAREYQQAEQRSQQGARDVTGIELWTDLAGCLPGLDPTQEETLRLLLAVRYDGADFRIVRGDFERGVGQKAASA